MDALCREEVVTLIVGACNEEAAILVADTRLSNNGRLVDDLSPKMGSLSFHDGRLLYAYTGVGRFGSFITRRWLLGVFADHVAPSMTTNEALLTVKARATEDFHSHPDLRRASADIKRLTIVFVGHVNQPLGQQPVAAILSNFENYAEGTRFAEAQDQFCLSCWPTGPGQRVWTGSFGYSHLVPLDDTKEFEGLVRDMHPVAAIRDKAEKIIVRASADPHSHNSVGSNVVRAVLPADRSKWPIVGFSSSTGGDKLLLLDQFDAISSLAICDPTFEGKGIVAPRAKSRHRMKHKIRKQL